MFSGFGKRSKLYNFQPDWLKKGACHKEVYKTVKVIYKILDYYIFNIVSHVDNVLHYF